MKLSIIIPCFNEIKTIDKIVDKIKKAYKEQHEIIIIDDFSTDGSREKLKGDFSSNFDHVIFNEKNYGKGFSIKLGIKKEREMLSLYKMLI